jgi:macrolide-specific efflux system membrane fusion protein
MATLRRPIPWLWISLLIVIVITGVGWAIHSMRKGSTEALSPRVGPIIESIYGLGTVKTARDFELKLAVPGRITALHVKEGQPIRRGDPLIRFDDLGVMRAPFDGVVTSLPFHLDDTVFAQQAALKIEDLSDRYIEVSVEQRGALRIRRGQPVHLVFESIRNDRFDGKVSQIYSRNGDFIARIDVPALPPEVLPGMTADVAIEVSRTKDVLLIPAAAVASGRVIRERGGNKEKIAVKLGAMDGNWAEVLQGDIRPDDQLVVKRQGETRKAEP